MNEKPPPTKPGGFYAMFFFSFFGGGGWVASRARNISKLFRMCSTRIPVLRLGSRDVLGPGGDQKSLRLCSPSLCKRLQASASVGECRASSGVANCCETQNRRHFLRFASQKGNSHRDREGRGRETQNCLSLLDSSCVFASQKCQQSQGSGGSWSRNAELLSLLDSSCVFASQKCQQSQGSGGSWSRNAELLSLLDSSCVFASQKCQQSRGSGGSCSRNAELSSLSGSSSEKGTGGENSDKRRGERGIWQPCAQILESRPWGAV